MKTIDFSYFIERYIAGEMDQTEKIWFEKELQADLSLQKEVKLRRKTDKILERQDIISLRNKLSSIEAARTNEKERIKGVVKGPRFRYAAVITGLVIIGSLLLLNPGKMIPEELLQRYNPPYVIQETTRSADAIYNEGVEYYRNGEYSKALEAFEKYLDKNPESMKIQFFSGAAKMEQRNYPGAEASFKKVIDNNNNLYIDDANFYLAMCYIQMEKINEAKAQFHIVIDSNSKIDYVKLAKRMLRKL